MGGTVDASVVVSLPESTVCQCICLCGYTPGFSASSHIPKTSGGIGYAKLIKFNLVPRCDCKYIGFSVIYR